MNGTFLMHWVSKTTSQLKQVDLTFFFSYAMCVAANLWDFEAVTVQYNNRPEFPGRAALLRSSIIRAKYLHIKIY